MKPSFLLTFEAPDQPGIQAQTATLLNDYQATLIDVASFSDPDTQRFFSRIEFQCRGNFQRSTALEARAISQTQLERIPDLQNSIDV